MGMAIFIIWCVLATAAGAYIGWKVKGRPLTGFFLGLILGWLGVLILAFLPRTPEMQVRKRMYDQHIADEVERRRAGGDPWGVPGSGSGRQKGQPGR